MDYYTLGPKGIQIRDFSLRHTIESAQPLTFFADYNLDDGTIDYPAGSNVIKAVVHGSGGNANVRFTSKNLNAAKRDFVARFALKDNMNEIYSHIDTDMFVHSSIEKYRGMRITINDPWETTLCFILSQYNNIKRIRLIVRNFVSEFGTAIADDNGRPIGKSFPTSSDLMRFTEKDFRLCGAGFRAKYIVKAAEYCTNSLDLYRLRNRGYDRLKEELMNIVGVGDKVADCIALMGYGKREAFPIDVWVKRTLENVYFGGKEKKIKELHRFAEERWGRRYMGYAQQYIFHKGRNI